MVKTIGLKELQKKKDEVILIEVLDPEQYNDFHIKGAINVPYKKIASEAEKKFKKDEEIVVYCSDSECQSSKIAADKLDDMGYENVWHYKGGKKEWKEAGLPVES